MEDYIPLLIDRNDINQLLYFYLTSKEIQNHQWEELLNKLESSFGKLTWNYNISEGLFDDIRDGKRKLIKYNSHESILLSGDYTASEKSYDNEIEKLVLSLLDRTTTPKFLVKIRSYQFRDIILRRLG